MAKQETIIESIPFTEYYNSLSEDEKTTLREKVTPKYMAYTSFYHKIRNKAFTELEIEKLEEITNQKFSR